MVALAPSPNVQRHVHQPEPPEAYAVKTTAPGPGRSIGVSSVRTTRGVASIHQPLIQPVGVTPSPRRVTMWTESNAAEPNASRGGPAGPETFVHAPAWKAQVVLANPPAPHPPVRRM